MPYHRKRSRLPLYWAFAIVTSVASGALMLLGLLDENMIGKV